MRENPDTRAIAYPYYLEFPYTQGFRLICIYRKVGRGIPATPIARCGKRDINGCPNRPRLASKQIVPENKTHNYQHHQHPRPIDHLHDLFGHGTAQHCLHGVEQEMSAVERRYG